MHLSGGKSPSLNPDIPGRILQLLKSDGNIRVNWENIRVDRENIRVDRENIRVDRESIRVDREMSG